MRLFVGIPCPPEPLAQLSATVAQLRSAGDGLRWTAPESWHITLQFLGETIESQARALLQTFGRIRSAPFMVQIDRVGAFERAGVVYAGVLLSPELSALQQQVAAATAQLGFAEEKRAFRPHITLARSKSPRALHSANLLVRVHHPIDFNSFNAQQFRLFESFLEPSGARYLALGSFPLQAEI